MNKVAFVIIGVCIVVLFIAVLIMWALFSFNKPATSPNNTYSGGATGTFTGPGSAPQASSTSPEGNTTASSSVLVTTNNGGTLPVRNFMTDAGTVQDPANPGYYYLGNRLTGVATGTAATGTPAYVIEYIAATQYFNITLLREPIAAARDQAEKYLMNTLGITQNETCDLKYAVSVPVWVNQFYAGKNLGFSFCPGATPLPD